MEEIKTVLMLEDVNKIYKESNHIAKVLGFKSYIELHHKVVKEDVRFYLDKEKLSIEKRCNLNDLAKILNLKKGKNLISILNRYFIERSSVSKNKLEFNVLFSINDRVHSRPIDAKYYIEESIDLIYAKITFFFRNK